MGFIALEVGRDYENEEGKYAMYSRNDDGMMNKMERKCKHLARATSPYTEGKHEKIHRNSHSRSCRPGGNKERV